MVDHDIDAPGKLAKACVHGDQRRSRRLFESIATCCSTLAGFDARICTRTCRGSIRTDEGGWEAEGMTLEVTEMDELRCMLMGKKPLVLLHRLSLEAELLISVCRSVPQSPRPLVDHSYNPIGPRSVLDR